MRGRAAGQPLNRVFEPSLSPGSHMLEQPSMLMASCSLLPPCCNAIAKSLPKSALGRLGGVGDGAPPGAGRAWIGLSGRFLALAICPRRAPHAGIRGYGPRRRLEALVISARSRPLEVGSRSRRDHSRLAKPPWAVATYTSVRSAPRAYR